MSLASHLHSQAWCDDVEYAGKRVVVIGSGATAVTIVPEIATRVAHLTTLQRSSTCWPWHEWRKGDPLGLTHLECGSARSCEELACAGGQHTGGHQIAWQLSCPSAERVGFANPPLVRVWRTSH